MVLSRGENAGRVSELAEFDLTPKDGIVGAGAVEDIVGEIAVVES